MIRVSTRWIPVGLLLAFASTAAAQDPADYFRQNCTSCHTIGGGRLTGPDLKGITTRQDRAWLVTFIQNPKAVIDAGDPYARYIFTAAGGVLVPVPPRSSPALADSLLTMIDAESAKERSQFAGTAISDRPFGPEDVAHGLAIFTGEQRLSGGGPPCLSCHSVGGVGAMGGGKLGPDLTLAYERLNGRTGTGAWLGAPAPNAAPRPIRWRRSRSSCSDLAVRPRASSSSTSRGWAAFAACGVAWSTPPRGDTDDGRAQGAGLDQGRDQA